MDKRAGTEIALNFEKGPSDRLRIPARISR